ncbi:chromate transporter [Paenibacillus piri]|uniref:Chromate transporter n=1 Tax=Paenibacillus piri TaxID=2547395 RepID=A0A4R5KF77_9BACL|nr:chromate transporter [Paenibacillus piri]TDF94069.1 chromate transporter [Paenibacillus piri]
MRHRSYIEIVKTALRLGLTSFGGPVAHLGYFREEYVQRRKWIDERSYADLVALCQFLPGPASSQVGIGIGYMRGGIPGALLAWLGFTLPSAVALALFAFLCQGLDVGSSGWIHGLKLAAVAIVAQAVWGMGKNLAPDRGRASIAIATCIIILLLNSALVQVALIALAGIIGTWVYREREASAGPADATAASGIPASHRKLAVGCLIAFFGLLALLPLLRSVYPSQWLAIFDSFYRSGSLVFGGGHVMLPLLEKEVVPSGWMSKEQFLAGYGATQAIPGPLSTFASYLGFLIHGWGGAAVATVAIFLPAFLLVMGALPFWEELRRHPRVKGALIAINASVVGILLAALYDPVWVSAIRTPGDFALALALFGALIFWKLPAWVVVAAAACGGALLSLAGL